MRRSENPVPLDALKPVASQSADSSLLARITAGFRPNLSLDFDHCGQYRNENDRQNHEREVVFDYWDVAEKITGGDDEPDPQDASHDAEEKKTRVIHSPDASDEGGEGADDWHHYL